jgi:hypothetical protein
MELSLLPRQGSVGEIGVWPKRYTELCGLRRAARIKTRQPPTRRRRRTLC